MSNDDESSGKDPEYLSTLERGLSVLRVFDERHPEMQLSEVAVASGLNPAVARRCLNTLVHLGYIAKNGRRFLLRPKVLEFGNAFLSSMRMDQVIDPFLQQLRDETGDSSSMGVRAAHDVLYVAHASTNRRIRIGAHVGVRFPIYATSMGKVLMAFAAGGDIERYLAEVRMQAFTDQTIVDPDAFRARLQQIRKQGYDSALNELDYGIVSVAVPVFGPDRSIVAAINCSASTSRVTQDDLVKTRHPLLEHTAREIEGALQRFPTLIHALRYQ
ncbi:IclR family transcriptional regulator domain-containing protein [Sphingosinicella microcystinivorans]|uniref:IclR family transcriptional regulator n=1 Tax=Sphingosinicella microcystinivorans TaxID=335406 RepID=A0AAD1D6P8_SPHMI|nr:IclR family transcriptional regulator C-terminal domain-containing protein [Sphingosinicella microcystinivorans]RKS91365.1 IclR family transcriptional regulator [Sphingosinicella microcystinivorans]BBE34338.1 IclR family transcriptional regulator [Sphingosinicella microcystinivorans]